jgi:hypothetical protein
MVHEREENMPSSRTGNYQLGILPVARAFDSGYRWRVSNTMLCLWLALLAALPVFSAQNVPRRGGRYDRQILVEIQKIITAKIEYKNVHAEVEDGIVALTGTVKLESSRVWIENKARHLPHVEGLRSQLTLSPPAPPDHELALLVQSRLNDAGFENVQLTAHNGSVLLSGVVRNQKELLRVLQIVRLTPGVKEAESKLTTAY